MKITKILPGILLACSLILAPTSAQEVRLLWSDTHNEVLDKANANIYTPVVKPQAAIDWQYSIGESQRAFFRRYPKDRKVVQEVEVVRSNQLAEIEPQTLTIDGLNRKLAERQ